MEQPADDWKSIAHPPKEKRAERRYALSVVPKIAARRYVRRCYGVDVQDLEQEGCLIALQAAEKFDPSRYPDENVGELFYFYVWRTVVMHLQKYIYGTKVPVSGNPHRAEEAFKGLSAAPIEDNTCEAQNVRVSMKLAVWRVQVSAKVRDLVGDRAEILEPILFEETRIIDVARQLGVEHGALRKEVNAVRKRLAADSDLRKLWSNRP